jgi:hypothetical protein
MSASLRTAHRNRTCRDCAVTYRYAATPRHANPRYCPACLPAHPRRCRTCTTRFHPQVDTDRHCPVCVVHPALF